MATHSNILAWKISWTEEPGGLQSMGSQESDSATKPPPNPSKTPLISPFSKSALNTIPFISATARTRPAFWQSALYPHLPAHPHRSC